MILSCHTMKRVKQTPEGTLTACSALFRHSTRSSPISIHGRGETQEAVGVLPEEHGKH